MEHNWYQTPTYWEICKNCHLQRGYDIWNGGYIFYNTTGESIGTKEISCNEMIMLQVMK